MKKLILVIVGALMSLSMQATELPLLKQQVEFQTISAGFVKLDGIRYEKVIDSRELKNTGGEKRLASSNFSVPSLYQGDMLKRGKLFAIERVSGSLFITSNDSSAFNDLAKMHNLNISYSKNNKAILEAPKGKELLSLLKALKADKRIKVVNLERITNKMKPE